MAFWKYLKKEPKFSQKEIELLMAKIKEYNEHDEKFHEYVNRIYFAWLIVRT